MSDSPIDIEIRAAVLAVILAVLDHECDDRVHDLCEHPDPHYAARVAHALAHVYVDGFDADSHDDMRADLAAEALALRGRT